MTFGRRALFGSTVAVFVCVAGLRSVAGQGEPAAGVQMSESAFKNVQVLRGIPVDEFMDAMGMFAAALGYDCASCHAAGISLNRDNYAVATPAIQRARQMVLMTNAINRANFAGAPRVTCFTCHRGNYSPEMVPELALQYSDLKEYPNAMTITPARQGTAGEVFTKYIRALGGAGPLAKITSFVATGTYAGFNTGGGAVPVDIFARAPDQRTQVVRMRDGEGVKAYDGRNAWVAEGWRPLPLMPLTGGNLAGVRLDALVSFPLGIQKAFSQWQLSSTTLDDTPVDILQGSNAGELPVNFYFDESGLLVRMVRWNRTVVGTVPTQVDYADYRDVAGVKMAFRVVVTWTDGQNTIELKDIRPNVAIDASRFARPAPLQRRSTQAAP
jgi:hypothetical protein